MKKVHYIGFYIAEDEVGFFKGNVPGMLKMRYVADRVVQAGGDLNILSLAASKRRLGQVFPTTKRLSDRTLYHIASLGGNNKLVNYINRRWRCLQLKRYIKTRVSKDDLIIFYHSYPLSKLIKDMKKKYELNIIVEIEEIYGFAAVGDRPFIQDEINSLKEMNGYVLVNDMISSTINEDREKSVVSYGVCNIPKRSAEKFHDGYIHVVYAGTIEPRKRGAFTAIESAEFLPSNYRMHILGFGSEESVRMAESMIKDVNDKSGCKKVEYHGMLTGKELDDFLFKCHIGLSSNVMRPNFANHTFPSKVITYMCHGLEVVLGYAEAFDGIEIAENWVFFYEFNPEKIAGAITKVKIMPEGNNEEKIRKSDKKLVEFLKNYINN